MADAEKEVSAYTVALWTTVSVLIGAVLFVGAAFVFVL